jgi:hypothetical protein
VLAMTVGAMCSAMFESVAKLGSPATITPA